MRKAWSWSAAVVLVAGATGCSTPDCAEQCGEAQEQGCVWVKGDCAKVCASVPSLGDKAGCAAQADAYEECVSDGEACDIESRCTADEAAFVDCVREHCAANPTDADCLAVETDL